MNVLQGTCHAWLPHLVRKQLFFTGDKCDNAVQFRFEKRFSNNHSTPKEVHIVFAQSSRLPRVTGDIETSENKADFHVQNIRRRVCINNIVLQDYGVDQLAFNPIGTTTPLVV